VNEFIHVKGGNRVIPSYKVQV